MSSFLNIFYELLKFVKSVTRVQEKIEGRECLQFCVKENAYSPVNTTSISSSSDQHLSHPSRLCCGAGKGEAWGNTESQRGNWNVPGRLTGSAGKGKDRGKVILVTPASKKNYFPISNVVKPASYIRAHIESHKSNPKLPKVNPRFWPYI